MAKRKIFLSGAERNMPDGGKAWREWLVGAIGLDYDIYDNTDYYNYTDKPSISLREMWSQILFNLRESSFVLVNLEHTNESIGTAFELGYAKAIGKVIIGFGSDDINPTCEECCDAVFGTCSEAAEYIRGYY